MADGTPVGTLDRPADFQRVLQAPQRSRSAHFALHHVAGRPGAPATPVVPALSTELSTGGAPSEGKPVDESKGLWLGAVLPKRHARRSVTRSLLKRQIRQAMARHAAALPHGMWVVRLRSPFDPKQFPSAASDALRRTARGELDALFMRAVKP